MKAYIAMRGMIMADTSIRRFGRVSLGSAGVIASLVALSFLAGCSAPPSAKLSLVAGGDCLLDRYDGSYTAETRTRGLLPNEKAADPRWSTLTAAAKEDSAFVFNLETTVGRGGSPKKKRFVFRAPEEALIPLAAFARPIAALANNHSMDYGPAGLLATIDALDARGIGHAGAGRNAEEAAKAERVQAGDMTISVLAFGFDEDIASYDGSNGGCIAPLDRGSMKSKVEASAASSTATIVMLHWGVEYDTDFNGYQQELARELVESGASLVLGSGPHVVQGIEKYRGALICYSLGNLIFDDLGSDETATTFIVRFKIERKSNGTAKRSYEIAPLRTRDIAEGPSSTDKQDAQRLVSEISKRSPDPKIIGKRHRRDKNKLEWFLID
jgi:poly-gamma-glutamate capsule biosynthesis protein CapA/YwtB (metallophosphatase superfamily)